MNQQFNLEYVSWICCTRLTETLQNNFHLNSPRALAHDFRIHCIVKIIKLRRKYIHTKNFAPNTENKINEFLSTRD